MARSLISAINSSAGASAGKANNRQSGSHWWLSGALALLLIAGLTLLPLTSLFLEAGSIDWATVLGNLYTQRVIRFSLYQATLSTLLALAFALPVALALAHTAYFRGRHLIVSLFSLSLVIPTIVAIYGIVAVFGRSGWVSELLGVVGAEPLPLYGMPGILIAHVFFNMPLATRVILVALETIPDTQWRLATQLGMRPAAIFKSIEWPAIRGQLPGLALLVFTLCFTSFAIVLTLGGGPRATTIEVAIYQALRFDFDITLAVALACIQLSVCLFLTLLSTVFKSEANLGFKNVIKRPDKKAESAVLSHHSRLWHGPWQTGFNTLVISLATLFVLAPLLALIISGFNKSTLSVLSDPMTLKAMLNTCIAAISSAVVALTLAMSLLTSARHLHIRLHRIQASRWLQLAGNVILILPPVVLGTGLFLLLRPFADVFSLALLLVILINSLMALPFVLRMMDAPVLRAASEHDRLIRSLGLQGINRWRLIDWPQLRKPIALAFAIAATLSAGDFSAIALFGSEQVTTLPLLLYQRMGSYRLDEAAVTASLLLLLCLFLFLLLQRLIGGRTH